MTIFKSINNNNKTYDSEFITSLAKGLDERWKVSDLKNDDEEEIKDLSLIHIYSCFSLCSIDWYYSKF